MLPILFWAVAVPALVAAVVAAIHRRPAASAQALLLVWLLDAVELFIVGAPLLAVELLVVALGGAAVVWAVLVHGGREKLGAPGMVRYSLAKLVALLLVFWLAWRLGEMFLEIPVRKEVGREEAESVVLGGWLSVFLLGTAVACTLAAVRFRRVSSPQEEEKS